MIDRDFAADPRPGDIIAATIDGEERHIWVQIVERGQVFSGPVEGGVCLFGGIRMPLEQFTGECRRVGARLVNK